MSMLSAFRTTVNILSRNFNNAFLQCYQNKYYHLMNQTIPLLSNLKCGPLLAPKVPAIVPSCGFKVKGRLRRRCKDCYYVTREERLYIICPTHPRHKQMAMKKKEKNLWMLSHATQGKIRPW